MVYNPSQRSYDYQVKSPREGGRGAALNSIGVVKIIEWIEGNVVVDGVIEFSMPIAPLVLDLSYDTADRPVVCWEDESGITFVRYFDPVPNNYTTLNCGIGNYPAVHNDYPLLGNDIKLVYLKNNLIFYRQHVEKFAIESQLHATGKLETIQQFGIGIKTNSLNVVGVEIP